MAAALPRERVDCNTIVVGIVLLATLILSIAGAANAADPAFRPHAFMFAIASAIGPGGLLSSGRRDPVSMTTPPAQPHAFAWTMTAQTDPASPEQGALGRGELTAVPDNGP